MRREFGNFYLFGFFNGHFVPIGTYKTKAGALSGLRAFKRKPGINFISYRLICISCIDEILEV